jgi:hypothetical protein
MSTYGLLVKNSAGSIIIDGVSKNFAFYESGSGTITSAAKRLDIAFATPTPQIPIIAIQPSDTTGYTSMMGYNKSGSNWTGFTVGSNLGSSFNWKAYIAHPTVKAENYGLLVKDPAGEIIFDSARTYFKIYSVTTSIALANTSAYQDITHAGISNPYYLWAPERFAWQGQFVGGHWIILLYRTSIKKIDSTSVRLTWQILGAPGSEGGGSGIDSLTQSLIVLK